uniref:hypothetical protein n=1 Tax=Flavobacterium sp. TaxID=239 RepID=UPI0040491BFB
MNNAEMILCFKNVNDRILTFEKKERGEEPTVINKNKGGKFHFISILLFSIVDFFLLLLLLLSARFKKKKLSLVYTTANLCSFHKGKYSERIIQNATIENKVYINQGRETIIKTIDNHKVYNIGGLVKLIALVFYLRDKENKLIRAYSFVNNFILYVFYGNKVYLLCHYDLNGISIVFSKHRKKINLIEVQHGGMINYPAYSLPSPVKIADAFIVKNEQTVAYLETHLNKNYTDIIYTVLPYPKTVNVVQQGIHILYASTVEIGGFHPVFLHFLENHRLEKLSVNIRLHPREKEKKIIFESEIKKHQVNYKFDDSKNWLESNTISNLIVISPWSSIIEEAVDNGFKTIIIDEVGKKRYSNYLENNNCFYSENLMHGEFIK